MKIAGIIAEYNPFHTGHAYHIAKTREMCDANYIICVISGHFTQRGEPAVYDKWARARAAVASGADLVLELPFAYATQSAEGFAQGGIRLLTALHCVDYLSFGAEMQDIPAMKCAAEFLLHEPADFRAALKDALLKGVSFPAARAHALAAVFTDAPAELWTQPNNILGIEYIKAILSIGSSITPMAIKRKGGSYSSAVLHDEFSSAQAIRHSIYSNGADHLRFLSGHEAAQYGDPVFPQAMFPYLMFALRSAGISGISNIQDVSEGLEYKIYEAARHAETYDGLIDSVKSKRFAYTRIQRILLYCLFGLTRDKISLLKKDKLYARVLGVREKSLPLLSLLAQNSDIPLVTKACEFPKSDLFEMDVMASDIYALLAKKIAPAGRDYTERFPII